MQSDRARAPLRSPVCRRHRNGRNRRHLDQKRPRKSPDVQARILLLSHGPGPYRLPHAERRKGLLSVCDKAIFLVHDDASLKSVKGKINALDSIGGVLQLKKYAHAITSDELLGGIK